MKRDMDLVRKILFSMEEMETGYVQNGLEIAGYASEQIGYHVCIMTEARLLVGLDVTTYGSSSPKAIPSRLTWEGHDFLDACRDDSRWNTAKGVLNNMGGASVDVIKMVLIKLMETQALALISLQSLPATDG